MSQDIARLMARVLFDVFSEHDAERRRSVIKELFSEDVTFADPEADRVGHDAIDRAVAGLHSSLPAFVFTLTGPAQTLTNAGRQHWGFGPPGEAPKVTGTDFVIVKDEKIVALYTFLDANPVS